MKYSMHGEEMNFTALIQFYEIKIKSRWFNLTRCLDNPVFVVVA